MYQNNFGTIDQLISGDHFFKINTFDSEKDSVPNEILFNEGSYQKITYQSLEFLFCNYNELPSDKIDELIRTFVLSQINFYKIIEIFLERPDSILLDIAKTCLMRYDEQEFHTIISYLKLGSIDEFVKAYFIETITIWDSIKPQIRERELKNVLNSESNEFLKEVIQDAINGITG